MLRDLTFVVYIRLGCNGGSVDRLLEAMKWSQIYDRLEDAVACLEHTANVIERMILKKV